MQAPTAPNVGERLFLWRNSKGWSQDETARRTGVSRSSIAMTEIGRSSPRLSTLRRLAWTFGTDVETFLNGEVPVDRQT